MGREKKAGPGPPAGNSAKDRHNKKEKKGKKGKGVTDWGCPLPPGLEPRRAVPQIKTKHQSYFELVENKDKKKKLEFQDTVDSNPPPGFEFVPIGNPKLTSACKELSREQDAMIFIVSAPTTTNSVHQLSHHLHRTGHHIRQMIVEQARVALGDDPEILENRTGVPEPIPDTQEEINEQADKAIRDLFPRIPHTDRQTIIEHAFKKGSKIKGGPLVGLAKDITLSRRVQLAVLAHIRHNHTRYDELLRQTSYINARKAVEPLCLDIIVKWRGDEETGRDQLEEILREVIVLSDSEDEDEDDTENEDESNDTEASSDSVQELRTGTIIGNPLPNKSSHIRARNEGSTTQGHNELTRPVLKRPTVAQPDHQSREERRVAKKAQRGFKRYEAVRQARWDEAKTRSHQASGLGQPVQAQNTTAAIDLTHEQERFRPQEPTHQPMLSGSHMDVRHHALSNGHTSLQPSFRRGGLESPRNVDGYYSDRYPVAEIHSSHTPQDDQGLATNVPQSRQAPRAMVRADELQDYLVPSIEPASPGADSTAAPVFVRRVTPAAPALAADQRTPRYTRVQSPMQRVIRTDRSAVHSLSDRPNIDYFVTSSAHRSHPYSGQPRGEVRRLAERSRMEEPVRLLSSRDVSERRAYIREDGQVFRPQMVESRGNEAPRNSSHRPIVVEEWPEQRSRAMIMPSAQRNAFQPYPREMEVISVRRPAHAMPSEGIMIPRDAPSASSRPTMQMGQDRRPMGFITITGSSREGRAVIQQQYRPSPPAPQQMLARRPQAVEDQRYPRAYEKYGSPMMIDPPHEARPSSARGAYFDPSLRPLSPMMAREVHYDEQGRAVLLRPNSQPPAHQTSAFPPPGAQPVRRQDGVYVIKRDIY